MVSGLMEKKEKKIKNACILGKPKGVVFIYVCW